MMITTLNVIRYPKWLGWAGFISMALFRIPLIMNRQIRFWKLMGSGRNGTFDMVPEWRQWAILLVQEEVNGLNTAPSAMKKLFPFSTFIASWHSIFHCEVWQLALEPLESHGSWDGKQCFGTLPKQSAYEGVTAVLTRATIRFSKLHRFWSHVNPVADRMVEADGFIMSLGIGEVPFIKQATFSIWQSKAQMKQFAYQQKAHTDVISKTRKEKWYREEMFVQFKIISSTGSIAGKDPFNKKP